MQVHKFILTLLNPVNHSLARSSRACSRLSLVKDERKKEGEREKIKKTKSSLVLFSRSPSFIRSSTTNESLQQASWSSPARYNVAQL